ncbi:hypothetical protein [Saccharococcus thermophilus]|uniref:CHASE2 domain-containing sensor protein n=1 Tax=Saccharococcus thermophilus TaxID=29396 RepID=A0A846MLL1_9BACL|nr:hypothetical protein [Saccharococcus thermophilus]NIK16531.1 CHASE2 domain-containing sensor protein [Saccharococcus thermophilus]
MKQVKKAWLAFLSALLFLAGKLKWVLALLKFLKLSSLLSLFLSIGAYALVYGWKFAVVLALLTAYGQAIMGVYRSVLS